MSTFIRSAIFAAAVLAGISAVEARSNDVNLDQNGKTTAQYDLNSADDVKAFWDAQHTGS